MTNTKNEFTEEMYQYGKSLIECLDKEGFIYPLIMWIKFPDKEEWSLLFGIPGLKIIGSPDILNNMKRIINKNELNISTENISLIDSMDELSISIKSCIRLSGISRMKVSSTQMNNVILPESVYYRVS
ncbi:MAG: hypothetical protein WAT71_17015 [Ignavibacteria bacterium]